MMSKPVYNVVNGADIKMKVLQPQIKMDVKKDTIAITVYDDKIKGTI